MGLISLIRVSKMRCSSGLTSTGWSLGLSQCPF